MWKLLEKRNTKAEVFKNMEIHIIEIPKWLKDKKEIVKKLLNKGMTTEEIIEITGFDEEEIIKNI